MDIKTKTSDPTVAVAFGSGGARGFAHIHVIEVLNEMGVKPVAISGASIGSIMGAGMASGMTGKEIRDYTLDLSSKRAETVARYITSMPNGFKNMFNREFSLGQLDCRGILETFLPKQIKASFEELEIPLSVSVTDYYGSKETVLHEGDLYGAMAASASIPGAFRPVKLHGRYMVDGGFYNPVPFNHLHGRADIIIGVEVIGTPIGDASRAPKAIDSIYGASQLMMQSILSHQLEKAPPTILLRPNVSKYRVQDVFKTKQVLADSEHIRDQLKRELDMAMKALSA